MKDEEIRTFTDTPPFSFLSFVKFLKKIVDIYNADRASQVALVIKNLPDSAGVVREMDSIPGLGRSPGGGHGNPLQYSCLENPWTEEPGGPQSMGLQRCGYN